MRIQCIVVDDEPLAREGIADYVRQVDFLELVGTCSSAIEANNMIGIMQVDLIFLDIEMPKLSGLAFVQSLSNPPMIVFSTAYPDHALKGFELDVLDYLVKPVSFERFLKAANKAKERFKLAGGTTEEAEKESEYFFIKTDKKLLKIKFSEIEFIEGLKDYVKIHTSTGFNLALVNLKNIESKLPENNFFRVHKSYIVSMDKITSLEGNFLTLGQQEIPIGKEYKDRFYEKLITKKIISR
jgi:two-component system LytT family response regulator